MKPESTFSEALARHRQLMQYFGAKMTVEDHQRGAMLEALHLLEIELPFEARDKLLSALKEHGTDNVNGEAMISALNCIEPLGNPNQAANELRWALAIASKPNH